MARKNNFEDLIGLMFSVIVFFLLGSVMVKSTSEFSSLSVLMFIMFIIGGASIVFALLIKAKEILENIF